MSFVELIEKPNNAFVDEQCYLCGITFKAGRLYIFELQKRIRHKFNGLWREKGTERIGYVCYDCAEEYKKRRRKFVFR